MQRLQQSNLSAILLRRFPFFQSIMFSPSSTPSHDGYYMPAEWHPHTRCWMLWPCRPDNWRDAAGPARVAFQGVIAAIAQFERVTVGVPKAHMESAVALLQPLAPQVDIVEMESDDSWMRDTGPTFVIGEKGVLKGVHWHFNAWGQLGLVEGTNYVTWEKDKLIAAQALKIAGADRYRADFVLEGGSIHVDGEGTLLTTEECLLNQNRNPDLSKEEIESRLRLYLGVRKIIWLPRGLYGDEDTNGHIDNFCCFVRPGVVLLAWTDDASDPQYEISREAEQVLSSAHDAQGRTLSIIKIPIPPAMYYTEEDSNGCSKWGDSPSRTVGDRLAGSYVNYYLANGKHASERNSSLCLTLGS